MTRAFFERELDTVATFWRIYRRDGIAHGFTAHDRDLWFGGIVHRAAPGLLPSAIRRTAELADDEAEVSGALAHDTLAERDLAAGRFDGARAVIGAVDWQTLEQTVLYHGAIAGLEREGSQFSAALISAKAQLASDPVPRTSPTCRARFCDRGCTLPAAAFSVRARIASVDADANTVTLDGREGAAFAEGELRWIDGPLTGALYGICAAEGSVLTLDRPLEFLPAAGARVLLREGCDHTIATCASRFGNALNFQGEPFVPGNDLLAQYPQPR